MATRQRRVKRRMVVDGEEGITSLLSHMAAFAEGLAPATSWTDIVEQSPNIIRHHSAAMTQLLAGQDIFDVLELVRQHEIPVTLTGYKESQDGGLAAVVDVVALVAMGLGTRMVPAQVGDHVEVPYPNTIIPRLCALGRDILKLSTMLGFALASDPRHGPLGELAGELRTSELMLRGKHYESVGQFLNDGVFSPPHIRKLLEANLGFKYDDIEAVRNAIRNIYTEGKSKRLDIIGRAAAEHAQGDETSAEEIANASQAFADFFVSPGASSAFTATAVTEGCGLAQDRVDSILNMFSRSFCGGIAETLLTDFVHGTNALAGIDLLSDGRGNYLMLQNGIPGDHVRRILEGELRARGGNKAWDAYGRTRDRFAERLAAEHVSKLLGVAAPTYKSLKYLAPTKDNPDCDLSKAAQKPITYAGEGETDALFIVDDVAVCVEVKAGSIRDKARSGNVVRIADDLKKTIGEATVQAQRVESLIHRNGGLWRKNGKWLDLSMVREVRSIVACLDDFGPLAIAADTLVRANLLPGDSIPWIVSLHDLAITEKLLTTPASFLLYLRRRTEPQAARTFVAVDELDVLMWFMQGGFYFEPNPDVLHARYPTSPPPTPGSRRRFRNEAPTRVGTMTDDLDAWMYFEEGASAEEAPKPTRVEDPDVARLLAFLQDGNKPGWLRFGADLMNLSSIAQRRLMKNMATVVARTRSDHEFHSLTEGFVTPWGQAAIFVGSQPAGMPDARQRLAAYMTAKKYQLRADRALGLLVDEASAIRSVEYRNDPWTPDEAMDRLVAEMRLVPPERMRRGTKPPPWRANARTNRKSGKKRK